MEATTCPRNSIVYNESLCACVPGFLFNQTTNSCSLFNISSEIYTNSGVDYYAVSFPETILSFDTIRKFSQSQALFLEATLVLLLSWLLFCFSLRFTKLGGGDRFQFKLRWWISRLDVWYSTMHWLDDQKPVVKRKTELGGAFTVAGLILFIGLCTALLYQIISKRTIEIHNVRAISAQDLASFMNDMEFNITTVSSMSCANMNHLPRVTIGSPGIDQRQLDLPQFASFACHNTSSGPKLTFKCDQCHLASDFISVSWQFFDKPNAPATAVGFQFNLSSSGKESKKHMSLVGGVLKNSSTAESAPLTFRGKDPSILKFTLFPQIYRNLHDLKLIQPLFHEFLPGSFLLSPNDLRNSLQSPDSGTINVTLYLNALSSYVVEIDNRNLAGLVSFLADLGGLYCISIGIFLCLLAQCEHRIKSLRYEDSAMRMIRNRTKAQRNWDKVRRYVAYTWGSSSLYNLTNSENSGCFSSVEQGRRRRNKGSQKRKEFMSTNRSVPSKKAAPIDCINNDEPKRITDQALAASIDQDDYMNSSSGRTRVNDASDVDVIPFPPLPELKNAGKHEIEKRLQQLFDYNSMLRKRLIEAQTSLNLMSSQHQHSQSS